MVNLSVKLLLRSGGLKGAVVSSDNRPRNLLCGGPAEATPEYERGLEAWRTGRVAPHPVLSAFPFGGKADLGFIVAAADDRTFPPRPIACQ
jgi:hypothetical protein